jgi:YVTN family beta-propeller protein
MLTRFAKTVVVAVLAISAGFVAYAQSVKGTITLSGQPEGLAVNFFTNHIYVAIPSGDNSSDSLSIIDGKSDTVVGSITIPPIGQAVAVDVVRDLVYVAGCYTDDSGVQHCEVALIYGWSNKVKAIIPVTNTTGIGLLGIAVNPISGTVYVTNASDNVVDVIRAGAKEVSAQIPVANYPVGIAVSPFTNQVYVALSNGTADVIDGNNNTITATATTGSASAGVAVNWVSGNVFVTDNTIGLSAVAVLDKSGNILSKVAVGEIPYGVDVDFGTNLAFVTNIQSKTVSVIDGKTNTVSSTLPVSGIFVAANPTTEKVYISGLDNSITVLKEK